MYKCIECGAEYETKPEYCDCGNDTFEQVESAPKSEKASKIEQTPQIKISSIQKERISTPTPQAKIQQKKTFQQQYPGLVKFIDSIDPISGIIFFLCIALSIYIGCFTGKTTPETKTQKPVKQQKVSIDIPSIDSFWDNTPAKQTTIQQSISVKNPEPVQPPVTITPTPVKTEIKKDINKNTSAAKPKITQTKPATTTQKTTNKTQTQQKSAAATTQKTTKTNTTAKTPTKTTQKSSTNTGAQTVNKIPKVDFNQIQNNAKNAIQTQNAKTAATNTKTVSQTTKTPNVNTTPAAQTTKVQTTTVTVQQPKVDTAAIKREYNNYKTSLRNALGKKINFANVIGDGECVISFRINSSGKLIDRKFYKQSSNITLNDAVYSAVMSLPSYNPPPSGYKNETLYLKITFYNGNFNISLN